MAAASTRRKILAVIPMRSGSTGVTDKNIREICGKPLFCHMLASLTAVKGIDRVIVSTDDQRYAELAKACGVDAPFLRPARLADTRTRLHYVMQHALNYFDGLGEQYDAVLSAQATAPLIEQTTIEAVIRLFGDSGADAVGTGSPIAHGHPYLAKTMDAATGRVSDFIKLPKEKPRYPRQVRPVLYYFNGALFLRDRSLLAAPDDETNALGAAPLMHVVSEVEGLNIDSEDDLRLAEYLIKERHA